MISRIDKPSLEIAVVLGPGEAAEAAHQLKELLDEFDVEPPEVAVPALAALLVQLRHSAAAFGLGPDAPPPPKPQVIRPEDY